MCPPRSSDRYPALRQVAGVTFAQPCQYVRIDAPAAGEGERKLLGADAGRDGEQRLGQTAGATGRRRPSWRARRLRSRAAGGPSRQLSPGRGGSRRRTSSRPEDGRVVGRATRDDHDPGRSQPRKGRDDPWPTLGEPPRGRSAGRPCPPPSRRPGDAVTARCRLMGDGCRRDSGARAIIHIYNAYRRWEPRPGPRQSRARPPRTRHRARRRPVRHPHAGRRRRGVRRLARSSQSAAALVA